jgi:Tol biopolymer transport system component
MHLRNARVALIQLVLSSAAAAQYTLRASVDSGGVQGSFYSVSPSISADGRYVAFCSRSSLVPADRNQLVDVYVRDRTTRATTRVSVTSSGGEVGGDSARPAISADGRFVAFGSFASNLVPGDTNGDWDVFVHDRQTGSTSRVSVSSGGGAEADGASGDPSISADGRFVAFWSRGTTLVPSDANGSVDVFVRDLQTGQTARASLGAGSAEANGDSLHVAISGDGRWVAFESVASNLVPSDGNEASDVFVRDLQTGSTVRASVGAGAVEGLGDSTFPAISADGRFVAFLSDAPNLVAGDTNGKVDVFVRDLALGTTARASVSTGGAQADDISLEPSVSADGRWIAFASYATTLVPGDTNGPLRADAFLRDLQSGATTRVNLALSNGQDDGGVGACEISADGRNVVFDSSGENLVPGDTNAVADVFVRDLVHGPAFTSACDAGVAGVISCPCGNPPSSTGRGCDNSSSTGGAVLAASGGAFLSEDTLTFTTSGERPTAASFLLQGTAEIAAGAVYGQGVRCLTGVLRRLYDRAAVGGSVTVPDVAAFDPTVSARSAALGFPIAAGESRWYLVAYRDPFVLGGCPSVSTFNATQTGRVTWSP